MSTTLPSYAPRSTCLYLLGARVKVCMHPPLPVAEILITHPWSFGEEQVLHRTFVCVPGITSHRIGADGYLQNTGSQKHGYIRRS